MGMFDTLYFEKERAPEGITEWQTKDLYNLLYMLTVKGSQLYYIDNKQEHHPLFLTGVIEIHAYENDTGYQLYASFADGRLIEVGKTVSGQMGHKLPEIPAMDEDAKDVSKGVENTISWLEALHRERTWFQKLRINWRQASVYWADSVRYVVLGFKALFGLPRW